MTAYRWSQKANQERKKDGTTLGCGKTKDTFHKGLTTEERLSDILKRIRKGESLVSIAKLYGCSYQAIQSLRRTHAGT